MNTIETYFSFMLETEEMEPLLEGKYRKKLRTMKKWKGGGVEIEGKKS